MTLSATSGVAGVKPNRSPTSAAILKVLAQLDPGALSAAVSAPDSALAEKRFFTIAAVEPKGGTNAAQEPFPTERLPKGGGYVLKQPDSTGRWEVSTYVWMPSQITVNEGDEVTLEFVGINGDMTTIGGYDKIFTLKRGQVIGITFKADKPGVFPIVCSEHQPSMLGELIVTAKK